YCATFRTQPGSVVGLSITTSNLSPLSALMSPFKSPISRSTRPLKKSGRVLLRLINVTECPRAIAYSTCSGPVNPVPPRMRILSGFFARPTACSATLSEGITPSPKAPLKAAEVLRKSRREVIGVPGGGTEGRATNGERRTASDERRATSDERRNSNGPKPDYHPSVPTRRSLLV